MIHFISSRDRIGSSILTSLALHRCVGPLAPSLAQASPSHAVPRFKASDLPFTLATGPSSQVSSWFFPPWSHDSMSCLTWNKLLHHHMCKLCNISKPFPPPWHMLLTYMYLWTNHLCISHKIQLVHLSCHSITKTKQGPFTCVVVTLATPESKTKKPAHVLTWNTTELVCNSDSPAIAAHIQ
jgi:hypothetical protein